MKTGDKLLIYLLLIGFVVSSVFVWYQKANSKGSIAIIASDGQEIRRIDLSRVDEPYSFTVYHDDDHYNVISVEPGRIRVSEANCPEQIDVRQGWISDSTVPIVCLPHRLVIHIEEDTSRQDEIDGIAF